MDLNEEQFNSLVAIAIDAIPEKYQQRLVNVVFIIEPEPSPEQRQKLALRQDQTLFGLYEGVPLPQRGGLEKMLPDKITLFRRPLQTASANLTQLKENIRHTLWHEVAHYFGLDHPRIHELE
jgi:predicted Zn-dependent protease with MMP-like domain